MRLQFFDFIAIFLLSTIFAFNIHAEVHSNKASRFEIVIDPGHGGSDRGALRGRLSEAEIVLAVGLELQKLLKEESHVETHMTRAGDQGLVLLDRVKVAESFDADLFVSIHANSNPNRTVQGAEFYVRESDQQQAPLPITETAPSDVNMILQDLKSQGQLKKSLLFSKQLKVQWPTETKATIRRAPFYVVSKTSMPSVLIEVGFMTNPAELRKLNSEDYRKDLAQKIYKAIMSYKEKVDKEKSQSLN